MNMQMPMTMNGQFQNSFMRKQEVVKVKGENGARAFPMGPNESAILLDEDNPMIWLAQTDGAGYKTVTPYDITPHQFVPPIDITDLDARLKKLEEKVNESYSVTNERKESKSSSNKANVEQSKDNK